MNAYYVIVKVLTELLILAVDPKCKKYAIIVNGRINGPLVDNPRKYAAKGHAICNLIKNNNNLRHRFDICRTFDPTFMTKGSRSYTMCSYYERLGELVVEYLALQEVWILMDRPADIKEYLDRLAYNVYESFLHCANYYLIFFKNHY